ncbi:methyltransferase domain-containing protein [Roseomonas sp. GC11]|uniref:class I SAM-dependent methyltransferase n=1 Tax=Roseomonas sp. GC11 TaxID=2950546 RepID=UPI00210AA300|nr:class I SAM-dependent methyltransferase [Roseomonas sp. GC11]MCQ4162042.1 methyltransferase domain-containing protein [Roseomonas sp. GC11]
MSANYALKEEIRDYWSSRAESFDSAFGHRIPPGPEREAWQAAIRRHLGAAPLEVLELACGTGEVTGALRRLGHRVTGLDFSEAMLARARAKHAGDAGARFFLADAEHTREPEGRYDAVVCRHLVWTLTDPEAALADWFRVLKPGGHLLVFDGDFAAPAGLPGRLAKRMLGWLDRWEGTAPPHTPDLDRHAAIMRELPFADGLTPEKLAPMVARLGFTAVECHPHAPIARAQRQGASLRNRLRTLLYRRFILHARKP